MKLFFTFLLFAFGTSASAQFIQCYEDNDRDGYGDPNKSQLGTAGFNCEFYGWVSNGFDCNDNDAAINPGIVWYENKDGDKFTTGKTKQQCNRPVGYSLLSELFGGLIYCDNNLFVTTTLDWLDCDDFHSNVSNDFLWWFIDNDQDGYIANKESLIISTCNPSVQGVNYVGLSLSSNMCFLQIDCNDNNALEKPGQQWYPDADNDKYAGSLNTITQCARPGGYKAASELSSITVADCNDNDPGNFPVLWWQDADGDGYTSGTTITQCNRPTNYKLKSEIAMNIFGTQPEIDCDDNDPVLHPYQTWNKDDDGDKHGSDAGFQTSCTRPAGYYAQSKLISINDCNDRNATVYPDAPELCDGLDNDCDGQIDEGVQTLLYAEDKDGDGVGNNAVTKYACSKPDGYVFFNFLNSDCNDNDINIAFPKWYSVDADRDGYGEITGDLYLLCAATAPPGFASNNTDCYDDNALYNPATIWYKDADNDEYSGGSTVTQCTRPAGYKLIWELIDFNGDCDDDNANIHEPVTYFRDADGDGWGDPNNTIYDCSVTPPGGYVSNNKDCNDNGATVHTPQTYYLDADKDGYGDAAKTTSVCSSAPPTGYVANNTDCDDTKLLYTDADGDTYGKGSPAACGVANNTDCIDNKASIKPGATEVCDGLDNDCDGLTDEGCNRTVSINNMSVTEGNSGTKNMAFTVKLNAAAPRSCSVKYQTFNSTAIAGSDYTAKSGTVSFATGEITKTVNISIIGNLVCEPNEQFKVQLSAAVNLVIGTQNGIGTITNDDIPGIKISNVSLVEGNSGTKPFPFNVTLDKPSYQTVSVKYATANGSASSGSDYISTNGTLTFSAGQTSKTINVIVKGDNNPEPDETFKVVLTNPVNAIIITGTGTGTIKKYNTATRSSAAPENIVSTAPPIALTTTVWPNPAADVVNIKLDNYTSSKVTLQLVDRNGARIKEWKFSPSLKQNTYQLNIAGLAQGLYLIRITDEKGNTKTEKIVIGR